MTTTGQLRRTAWGPIVAIAGIGVVALLSLSPLYGFHRDELYFIVAGRHPDFGYDDQGPLTPLLTAASVAVLGLSPTAIRVLPAIAIGLCIVLTGMLAREFGAGRRAQVIASAVAGASGYLAAGHLASTTTYDLLAWTAVLWLVARLLAGGNPRLWLVVGLIVGLALQNKFIMLFLGASLVGGFLLARRWDIVRSPWAWGGLAIALVVWAPNVAWQVANGLPQLEMARRIGGGDSRFDVLLELLLLAGPLLFPVSIAGAWWLLRSPASRPWRAIGWAAPILLVLVVLSGGKSYYAAGILPPLMAAGGIAVDGWLARGRRPGLRLASLVTAGVMSLALTVVLVLPVLPPAVYATSPVAAIYGESAEQLGWPELVSTVERVAETLPAEQRDRSVILTDNYGEAGALELLGSGLPPVYSGHNAYARWGPPPDDRTAAIVVTHATTSEFARAWGLGQCTLITRVDNGLDLDNQEQGVGIWVCPQLARPWSDTWTTIRHLG